MSSFVENLSIRTKLVAGFGLALTVIVGVGVLGMFQLKALNDTAVQITEVMMPRVVQLDDIKRMIAEHQLLATRRVHTTDTGQLAELDDKMDAVWGELDRTRSAYGAAAATIGERSLFARFSALIDDYHASLLAVFRAIETGQPHAVVDRYNDKAFGVLAPVFDKLDEMIALARYRSNEAAAVARSVFVEAILLRIAVVMFAILAMVAAIAWITRNVSRPLLRLSDAMRRLSAGDQTVDIASGADRHDEIGILAAAVNGYRESLEKVRRLAERAENERRRFEIAVSNMPIGLAVFDRDRRLVLCNRRYGEMYGLRPELTEPGTAWEDIVRERVGLGKYVGADPKEYVDAITALVMRHSPYVDIVRFQDGRLFSLNLQPTDDGGWVSTHEDITDQRRTEARIVYLTRHDALTDLPNRIAFREAIEEVLERGRARQTLAVLCIDLDRFQNVNETLGHAVGDQLLKTVAGRLRHLVRAADTIARLGGDEFAILQITDKQPTSATLLARRIVESIAEPFLIGGERIVIGASIGIALAPADGNNADALLKSGDQALFRAKTEGRGTYRFFEAEMDARVRERRALETDLREALLRHQFALHYQPIANLARNEVAGFEALLRWEHPQRGMIQPDDFIPLAEEIGLIVPLGEWVLRRACGDAAGWPKHLKVAVNLSAAQFQSGRLLQAVITALATSGLAGKRLELEITETVLLDESHATMAVLHQLRGLGVRVCMDDFGTGYSSLGYLRSFPFDKIKIDRSFIRDLGEKGSSLAILRAVIGLGTSFGLTTTAEGVETQAQLDQLKAEGCGEGQGMLIGEPMPASAIADYLDAYRQRAAATAA